MQRYESYKPSAIPWIDELPQHWGEEKGKWLHRFRKDLNNRKQCDNVLSLTLRGVVNNDPDDPEGLVPKDYSTYQIFEKDDLVFKLIDLENFRTSRVGLAHERGIMSPAYLRVQPGKEQNPRYFYYYYFTLYQQGIYNKLGAGVRSTLGPTDLLKIGVPVPRKDEQDSIVAFLDQKTAEIDAAIAKKERMIELLLEQKKILITQSVLRGLSQDVSLIASGIDWIGKIPSHWKIAPVYSKFTVQLGKMLDAKKISGRHLRSYLRNTDVQWDGINTENLPEMDIHPSEIERFSVRNGDLLVCEGGDVGRCSIWHSDEGSIGYQKALHRVRPISDARVNYFRYFMMAASQAGALASGANTNTIAHLTGEMFRRMRFTCPPSVEQESIASFLLQIECHIKSAIRHVSKEIAALSEMKNCLIADIVTGKMKV